MVNEVAAFLGSHAFRKNRDPTLSHFMGFHKLTFAPQNIGMSVHRTGRHLVFGPFLSETLKCSLVSGIFLFSKRLIIPITQAEKVGLNECILIFPVLMKIQ